MNPAERHQHMTELFHRAMAIPPEGGRREEFLKSECGADTVLLEEMLRLVRAGAASTLEGAAVVAAAAATVVDHLREGPGTRIGPYKLLEQIGEGGFGVVFMAEQERPVVRRVALKIIKAGMDTRQVIARFEAERQALAMMDHPNIAKVLDAGATETGRPYFVMELVRGDPITEYSDKNNLSTAERLALFTDICHAVQHAHQKGIIHRDLKPSNVLVTLFDGRPIPKVIDFGIAKAVNQRLTDKTLFTAHRQLIGTPQYMSPEQAEMSGVDIDTRSDIYSLGVLLYELLTGTTPFDPEHLRSAALAEVQRIIREEEPQKPSTRLSQGVKGKTPAASGAPGAPRTDTASVAAHRRTDAAQLVRSVRGDLDWIVMKCLEKDRTRRYETANGLALDVQRHVRGEPVLAAPPSRVYRARRFVRRHRSVVTTGAFVAAALLLGLAGTTIGLVQADARRAEAETRRQETARVADFQARMLARIDAREAGISFMGDLRERYRATLDRTGIGETEHIARSRVFDADLARINSTDAAAALIARILLRPAVGAIDEEFRDQPAVDAALRQTLGDVYFRLGLFEVARPLQERALEIRRQVLGPDDPETLESQHSVAVVLEHLAFRAEAGRIAWDLIKRRRRVLGEDAPETIASKIELGVVALESRDPEADRRPFLRQTLEQARRVLGDDNVATLACAEALEGELIFRHRELAEGESLARWVLDGRRRVLGDDHEETIAAAGNVGVALQHQNRFAEAEPFLREAAERSARVLGEDHRYTIHHVNNYAVVLQNLGRLEEAVRFRQDVIERRRIVLGPLHPNTIDAIGNTGRLLYEQGRYAEAEAYVRDAIDAHRRAPPQDANHGLITDLSNLGSILRAQGRLAEAEPLLRETLETARRTSPSGHVATFRCLRALGDLLLDSARFREAEPLFREALAGYTAERGAHRWETIDTHIALGQALIGQARFSDALDELQLVERTFAGFVGATPERHDRCVSAIASLYEAWDKAEPGKGYNTKAAEWRERLTAAASPAP